MAFNWQIFRTRTLSAVVFVAVMLTGLLWNQWSFLLLFSLIHFGCWWEYLRLLEKIHRTVFHSYLKLGLMVAGYGSMLWFCGADYRLGHYGIRENFSLPVSAAGFALLLIGIFQKHAIKLKAFGAAALGIVYISLSWGFMIDLSSSIMDIHVHDTMLVVNRLFIPITIIASIWLNDTLAYIVGSAIGKTPLSAISPKKTWEGTVGGIILGVTISFFIIVYLFFYRVAGFVDLDYRVLAFVIIPVSLVAAITGTFGDLLESKLKRMAGVKDSGRILPGHGGFLDRFDSMLIAVPAVWLLLAIVRL